MSTKTAPFGFRFDTSLLERIEALLPRLKKRAFGMAVTKSTLVRTALEMGLDALELQLSKEEH